MENLKFRDYSQKWYIFRFLKIPHIPEINNEREPKRNYTINKNSSFALQLRQLIYYALVVHYHISFLLYNLFDYYFNLYLSSKHDLPRALEKSVDSDPVIIPYKVIDRILTTL